MNLTHSFGHHRVGDAALNDVFKEPGSTNFWGQFKHGAIRMDKAQGGWCVALQDLDFR